MKNEGSCQPCRSLVGALLALAWLTVAAGVPAAEILAGSWQLRTPLGDSVGSLLALTAAEGAWRCEVGAVEEEAPDLLHRLGRGWTLAGDELGGFVQAWHDPWQQVGPRAAQTFQRLLAVWAGDEECLPAAVGRQTRWRWRPGADGEPDGCVVVVDSWDDLPAGWRPQSRTSVEVGTLRRRLTARGGGRGGEGLSLHLRWVDDHLRVTAVRWPGSLTLQRPQRQRVAVPDEAFLPLWPLAEFLP